MGLLGQAKTLGGVGSILMLIPGVSIVGYILTLVAVKYVSDSLQDRTIFDNMLYAVITGIVGVAVGAGLLFTGLFFSVFTMGVGTILGVFGFLAVVWVVLVVSAIFIKRSFDTMATRLKISTFKTAGTLYFIGAILTIVLVGFVILIVAYIFQIIAFFAIEETQQPPLQVQPQQPVQPTRFCPNCGSPGDSQAAFCKSCGKPLS